MSAMHSVILWVGSLVVIYQFCWMFNVGGGGVGSACAKIAAVLETALLTALPRWSGTREGGRVYAAGGVSLPVSPAADHMM